MSCSAGPWKGLWVRRGYDPRLDPAARQWQALEFPVPTAWCAQERCPVRCQQKELFHTRSADAPLEGCII